MSARFRRATDAVRALYAAGVRDPQSITLVTLEPHLQLPYVVESVTA